MIDFRHSKQIAISVIATFLLTAFLIQPSAKGIEINGYAQAYCIYTKAENPKPSSKNSSFSIQELDLIFQKDLGSALSAFTDLQFLNTFSTEKGWGDLNLDQMWIKYSPARAFNVKFGHIVPTFNAFNEIKTKFPLLPHLMRPLIYEASLNEIVIPEEYLPLHAALQINGTASTGKLKLDYAIFGGNSDFIVSSKISGAGEYTVSGVDTTNFKLFGGRIGARISGINLGFSYTYDKSPNISLNKSITTVNAAIQNSNAAIPLVSNISKADRNRIGVDLSYTNFGLTLESEYIYVMNSLSDEDEQTLKYFISVSSIQTGIPGVPPIETFSDDLSRHFFYVNANYDILEKFFVTAGYSYLKNSYDLTLYKYGITEIYGGGGYRLNDNVTLKAQCASIRNDLKKSPMVKLNIFMAAVGASVYF